MASIQGIYLALFGRPADPTGLAYFNGITNNGANLAAISDLSGQQEYVSRFANMTNEQIVTAIYQSLFGRDPEKAGLDFFVGQLTSGKVSINNIAINILDGAAGSDKQVVDAKIAAANLFTTHLDLPAEIAAYSGTAAAQLVRTYLNGVNLTKPATEAEIDALIRSLLTNAGQSPGESDSGNGGTVTPPTGDKAYTGDVLLLNNDQTLKSYQYSDFKHGITAAVQEVVTGAMETEGTNVVLINNMTPINLLIGQPLAMLTSVIEQVPGLESYHEWQPNSLFLNVFGKASSITGTSGNDVVLVLDPAGNDHSVTGGRGNDVIIVADASGFAAPAFVAEEAAASAARSASLALPKHTIDGGAGEDIIVNIGGTDNVLNGGTGNDVIISLGNARDMINGGDGDDFIFGGASALAQPSEPAPEEGVAAAAEVRYSFDADFANGDVLAGGAGKDTFIYLPQGNLGGSMPSIPVLGNITSNGADTITDFKTGEDSIAILTTGAVISGEITAGDTANGYASFDAAASAAQTWLDSVTQPQNVARAAAADEPSATMRFILTANVADGNNAHDGYLFVDDDANGSFDFVIKLAGLTSVDQFSVSDVQQIDVVQLLGTISGGGGFNTGFDLV